ncbi:MAG TPA: DUF2975 domain-containing protein [Xanthobacteraceae bacterium]|nr:DUF2975 domain-containing protein [Xanthobacteraceae bacterium]
MPTLSWMTTASAETADPLSHTALRARIAWLCHLTRAAAAGWAAWVLIAVVWTWSDPAKIVSTVGHYLNTELGMISPFEFIWAFGVNVAIWIPDAAVAYCIWRLFGTYLDGHIFTADAAAWMQRTGVTGLIAVLASIVGRRIDWLILTSHAELPLSTRLFTQFVVPVDLLQVLFCLFLLAIGHVFRTAVQIANDHASIV